MIFVWSDTHFNHKGIITYCKRPYANIDEMNAALIDMWNHVVGPTDDVYHLGDFAFRGGWPLKEIYCQLNGNKHLIRGNHDYQNDKVLKLPWKSQHDLLKLRHEEKRYVLCHYPLETWEGAHRGYLHLHGHSHGTLKRVAPHRFDVGADVWEYPVSLECIDRIAAEQAYEATDHHGDL